MMTKLLTKLWAHRMQRLLALQHTAAREMLGGNTAASAEVADAGRRPAPAAAPRESRVRPRAAAWAAGEWRRAGHAVPATPECASRTLNYGLYLPAGHAVEGLPLVVMLHGCKQSMDAFAEGTRMNLLADQQGFAVVYPEQSGFAHPHQCWHWYDERDDAGGGEARAIVSLVDALIEEHGFDGSRVYLAGLSAGAGLATLLTMRWPERFAEVALHSGPAFGEANSGISALDVMRRGLRQEPVELLEQHLGDDAHPGMPALVVHGDDDTVVAPVNAEQLTAQLLRLNGLADARGVRPGVASWQAERDGHVVHNYARRGESVVRLCRVADLDHAWSGGDDTVPFHSATGPDASAMIWSFFSRHRRDAAYGVVDWEAAGGAG